MLRFFQKKVNRKLAAMCVLLALLICAATSISGYFLYRNSIYRSYNDFAYELDEIARSYVDGDRIAGYLDTKTTDAEYDEMARQLYTLYNKSNLSSIYICVPNEEDYTITNIYDVRIHDVEEENKKYYAIGVVDPMGVEHPEHAMEAFRTGERPDDYFIRKTKFGYNSSAMLPVFNSDGEPVALIVADVPILHMTETLNRYLLFTVSITVLIVAVFMAIFLTQLQRSMVRPLKTIAEETDSFTKSEIRLSEKLPKIRQADEIGQLAKSIYKMENDINTYIKNLTAVTAEKERIGAELDVAKHIQSSMLPCIFPAFPERKEIDIFATMNPAKEVGGDFYDFFMVDDRHLAIVMADVSGKGVPAALFMVIGKTLIKDHTHSGCDLGEVFSEVNDLLCESNSEGLFITAFEGVLDLCTGEFNFVNAGHEMPFICKENGGFEAYKIKPGFVLAGMEGMRYKAGSMTIGAGDKIFLYTDGVTEATNAQNELYGMERLENILNTVTGAPPNVILPAVKRDIDAFVGSAPQFDDITMLGLEYNGKMEETAK